MKIVILGLGAALILPFPTFGDQSEPRMAQVRPKDMNRTGERYYEDWQTLEVRTVDGLEDYEPRGIPLGRYGDRTDMQFEATGFYYTKQVDGKWWILSPDGHPLIHIAMNSVNLRVSDRIKKSFDGKYSSLEAWADDAVSLLKRYGYNGAGCWADVDQIRAYNERHNTHFSYVYHLSMVADYRDTLDRSRGYHESGQELFPVFDKEFEAYCVYRASKLVAYRDDPNLFGYSFDNELTWARDLLDTYLTLPEKDSGYQAAMNWLTARGLTPVGPFTDGIRDQFRAFVMDRYFSAISKAIREVDPNHMLLGSRFYWNNRIYFDDNQSGMLTNPLVFQTAGKYVDILQCNYYFRWTPVPEEIDAWTEWSGRPFMITEWYVKGDDTGMRNRRGAGWIVGTQEERGMFYQNFALQLLESPNCVGFHWFRYQDKEGSNRGVVDYDFNPYPVVLEWMDELNSQVYSLRDHFQ